VLIIDFAFKGTISWKLKNSKSGMSASLAMRRF